MFVHEKLSMWAIPLNTDLLITMAPMTGVQPEYSTSLVYLL